MSVKENNKYDETIIHKQSADLYSIHEDQLLFEEANPQKQHLKGHSRADESSKASVDSQVVQIKLEGLNVKSNSESDNEDTISVSTVNLSGEINVSELMIERIENSYGKISYSKVFEMQTNQRDSLNDLKKTLFELDTDQWERWNDIFKAIVDVFGVERYLIGSQPSPITLQILPKFLSLPTEKVDVDAANDIVDDVMSRIYTNDDGQLETSTPINDNLSIIEEFNEDNFSTVDL